MEDEDDVYDDVTINNKMYMPSPRPTIVENVEKVEKVKEPPSEKEIATVDECIYNGVEYKVIRLL